MIWDMAESAYTVIYPYLSLFLQRNLRRIRGKVLKGGQFSLMVYTKSESLRELCFNSLERIDQGSVKLCFTCLNIRFSAIYQYW